MTVDWEEDPGAIQTVGFWDGVGYCFGFPENLLEFISAFRPQALPVAPSALPLPPPAFHSCFAQGVPLFSACPASICLADSQAEAAEALLAEAPGTVPSTTADADRSCVAVSEDSHVWICSATRFVPEVGAVGEKRRAEGGGR